MFLRLRWSVLAGLIGLALSAACDGPLPSNGSVSGTGGPASGGDAAGGAGGQAASGGATSSGGTKGTGGCTAIEDLPPIVQVFDSSTGSPICDPIFSAVRCTVASVGTGIVPAVACSQATSPGCPTSSAHGETEACPFAIYGPSASALGNTCTLDVTAPGFATTTVAGVIFGVDGCVPHVSPSNITVMLAPNSAGGSAGSGP